LAAAGGAARRDVRRGEPALAPEQDGELAGLGQRALVVLGGDVHDPGAAAVRFGTAEAFHVDLLAGDAADHLGPGHEDPAGLAHDHDVGQRRPVRRTAGGRAEHHGDLRYAPRGAHHRREHLTDGVERDHPLGQPRTAGVPEAEHRHPLAHGGVDRVDDVPAPLDAQRAAHPGGVGGERDRRRAVDLAAPPRHPRVVPGGDQAQGAAVEERPQAHLRITLIDDRPVGRRGGRGHGVLRIGVWVTRG
jgi:hypothetical protein